MHRSHALLAPVAVVLTLALAGQQLEPGATAPALTLDQWVRGAPLPALEQGVVHLVEFWGADPSWAFARQRSFGALQRQHGDRLRVVCVLGEGEEPEYDFDAVATHFAEHGKAITFRIGYDGGDKAHAAWTAGQDAPVVFVVDGAGKVAWIGGFGFLDIALPKVLAGETDYEALAAETEAAQKQFLRTLMVASLKPQGAVAEMDKLLAQHPTLASFVVPAVFNALLESDEPQLAVPLQPRVCDVCIHNEDADSLNMLAWMIVDPEVEQEQRDLVTAERAARKAVELTREQDASILDTLARVYFWKRDYGQAVAWQRKAVALLPEGEERDALAATLAEYENLAGGR